MSGIAGAFGSIVSSGLNVYSQNKTNESSKELMREQNAFNLDMWNRHNEYNEPIKQMQRLREAGINPALAYTNGVANTSSGAPSASSTPNLIAPTFGNPITEMYDTMIKSQQLKNMETERELTGAKTEETRKNISLIEGNILNVNKDTELKESQIEEINSSIAGIKMNIEKMKAEISKLDSEAVHYHIQNYVDDLTKNAKIKQQMQQCRMNEKQLELLIYQALDLQASTSLKGVEYDLLSLEYENGKLIYNMNKNKSESWSSQKWYQNASAVMSLLGMALGNGSSFMELIPKKK